MGSLHGRVRIANAAPESPADEFACQLSDFNQSARTGSLFPGFDGAVVRALASHQCGPGWILGVRFWENPKTDLQIIRIMVH